MEDALTLMKRDHEEIAEILAELRRYLGVRKVSEVDVRSCFQELKRALVSHLNAEEESVYSKLKSKEVTRGYAYEGTAEHGVILDLVARMSNDAAVDEAWKAEFQILKNEIERHVEAEELELFPLIKKVFSGSELMEMGEDLSALKLLVEETAFMPPPGLKTRGSGHGARPDAPDYDRHGLA
jgi:hemerythrin-like domain-containing protein